MANKMDVARNLVFYILEVSIEQTKMYLARSLLIQHIYNYITVLY